MTEPTAEGGLADPDVALDREVEALSQRFPDIDPAELRGLVHETYDRLKDHAAVNDHLVAMTENQVTEQLRARGETVHVRGTD